MRLLTPLLCIALFGCIPEKLLSDLDGDGFDAGPDCDDSDPGIYPGAAETCDGRDQDCDGEIDEDALSTTPWFIDGDGDGHGSPAESSLACDPGEGWALSQDDCDDGNPEIHPGAEEICNGLDDDCDDTADEDAIDATGWATDDDLDGYGDLTDVIWSCDPIDGRIADHSDCADEDFDRHPGATESCNGLDDDCDEIVDEDVPGAPTWYVDGDGDGFGVDDMTVQACELPEGYADNASDCDDGNEFVNPDQVEICENDLDDDCDGTANDCLLSGELSLSDAAFQITGEEPTNSAGIGLASGHDVDGDGYDDILVGAYGNGDTGTAAGKAYVVYGDPALSGTVSLLSEAGLRGESSYDIAGWAVGFAGDLDGDGYADFSVGAPNSDDGANDGGAAYVFYGSSTRLSGDASLGTAAAVLLGVNDDDAAGYALAPAGDQDGDGYDDLLIGAEAWHTTDADGGDIAPGAVYLLYGDSTRISGEISLSDLPLWSGPAHLSHVGQHDGIAAEDLDGDGVSDLIFGSYNADSSSGTADVGATYIVYGTGFQATGEHNLADADAAVYGGTASDYLGYGVGAGGDVDGDGHGDLLVGAYRHDSNAGEGYVVYGDSTAFSGELVVTAAAGATLSGVDSNDYTARNVVGLGDVDGDDLDDVLIGAYGTDDGATDGGGSYLFYGGGLTGSLSVADADAYVFGQNNGDNLGYRQAGGDLDGDGYADLLVAAPSATSSTGAIWAFWGTGP